MQPAPTFGRRSAPSGTSRTRVPPPPNHDAFFASVHAELRDDVRERAVPRSLRAALLAGLVVGCCLAGLDVTRASESLHALSHGLLASDATPRLLPVIILLGLCGGARAAATSLLVAHAALRRLGLTGHLPYACGSAVVAGAFSLVAASIAQAGWFDDGLLPSHGLAIDVAAGAGAGFFYRVFTGAAPVA